MEPSLGTIPCGFCTLHLLEVYSVLTSDFIHPIPHQKGNYMGSYYTTTRKMPIDLPYNRSGPISKSGTMSLNGYQTTTSYRSSQPEGSKQSINAILSGSQDESNIRGFDRGHEFETEKMSFIGTFPTATSISTDGLTQWSCPVIPSTISALSGVKVSDQVKTWPVLEANAFGNRAMTTVSPTHPAAGVTGALAELRQNLPALVGVSTIRNFQNLPNLAKASADEWLNLMFGIAPTVADMKALQGAVQQSFQIVGQLRRDSGRMVRRRFQQRPEVSIVDSKTGLIPLKVPDSSFPGYGGVQGHYMEIKTKKTWFSGAFTYYLDPGDDLLSSFTRFEQEANKLLGTRFTTETLYNLAPYSWLVDWFTSLGSTISVANAFANDGLVLKYGYCMNHEIRDYVVQTEGQSTANRKIPPAYSVARFERKTRRRATPYGFGFDMTSLTDRQWSILVALGISPASRRY